MRVKDDGSLFMLEINANAGILYRPEEYGPADYMILYDKDGYYGFFDRIFRSALVRQKLRALDRARGIVRSRRRPQGSCHDLPDGSRRRRLNQYIRMSKYMMNITRGTCWRRRLQ